MGLATISSLLERYCSYSRGGTWKYTIYHVFFHGCEWFHPSTSIKLLRPQGDKQLCHCWDPFPIGEADFMLDNRNGRRNGVQMPEKASGCTLSAGHVSLEIRGDLIRSCEKASRPGCTYSYIFARHIYPRVTHISNKHLDLSLPQLAPILVILTSIRLYPARLAVVRMDDKAVVEQVE